MNALSVLFLGVSGLTLTWQSVALRRLTRVALPTLPASAARIAHRGLIRTSACRVLAAAIYVVLAAITIGTGSLPSLTLLVFSVVQVIWMTNAALDIRLRKRLASLR